MAWHMDQTEKGRYWCKILGSSVHGRESIAQGITLDKLLICGT